MKKIIALAILGLLSINCFANSVTGWPNGVSDYKKIIKKASKDELPVLVYFYTDWCSYCKRLNKEYLNKKVFKGLSSELHVVQINPEKSTSANKLFKSKYNSSGYPSVIVTVPGISDEFLKLQPFYKTGDLSPRQYVESLREMIASIYTKTAYQLFHKKSYRQSRQYLYKSLTYHLNDKNALSLIAITYHQEGVEKKDNALLEKAKVVYEKALSIYPGDPELLKNLRLLTG